MVHYQYEYGHADTDWLLLRWHAELVQKPEFAWTFCEGMASPSAFLAYFKSPRTLVFELDGSNQLDQAIWFEPSMSGAYLGMWSSEELRRTPGGKSRIGAFFLKVMASAFRTVPVLVSTIKDRPGVDQFLTMHGRIGFVVLGAIPYMFDGCSSYVLYLSKDNFYKHNARLLDRFGIKEEES